MNEPDLIVLRAHPSARIHTPPEIEGRWYDRSRFVESWKEPRPGTYQARPTGRFEVRDDGAVAEVWEIRLYD
jgi:hypothetical protein